MSGSDVIGKAELLPLSRAVPNTGSTARDHLANERTFLAWMRTSIAAMGFGLAITKVSIEDGGGVVGMVMLVGGLCLLMFAGARYFQNVRALTRGEFKVNTGGVTWLIICISFAVIACCAVIIRMHTRQVDVAKVDVR